jgi:oxygen-dependent protoporphyrinogen oxidase
VIVGGGITGLSCAYYMTEYFAERKELVRIAVLEGASRLGGNIVTENRSGFILDGGPDSWVSSKPDAMQLVRRLRLAPETIPTVEMHRRVYIAWGKELHLMPEGLVLGIPTSIGPMVTTGLFGWDAKLRMAFEPLIPARNFQGDDDESVGDFMARRLGDELTERLVAPLLGGIFAGDAYSISVRAAFPQLVKAEREHGSLVLAMREQRRKSGMHLRGEDDEGSRPAPSAFLSLRAGLGSLIEALLGALGSTDVRTGCHVRSIDALPPGDPRGRYAVVTASGVEMADDVVLTGPTRKSADVVRALDAELGRQLDDILGYASTATVFLAFKRDQVGHALDATGFIVPRSLGKDILAATWVSSKWDHRAPAGHVLMRVFVGGAGRDEVLSRDDAQLVALAMRELRSFVPIKGEPLFTRVFRFQRVSPQPYIGHLKRARAVRERLALHPGLHLAASGFDGVGIPDCIRQAEAIAHRVAQPGE